MNKVTLAQTYLAKTFLWDKNIIPWNLLGRSIHLLKKVPVFKVIKRIRQIIPYKSRWLKNLTIIIYLIKEVNYGDYNCSKGR